jgi:peroxiredoxin
MPAYEEDLSEFARYDAQVMGLSIDTIPTIKAWAKSLGSITYPLLSDFWPHGYMD